MSGYKGIKPRWKKGESGNPKGRAVGSKNRSTVVAKWLAVATSEVNPITEAEEELTQEDHIALAQIAKAKKGDTNAFNAIMDSAYGKPQQSLEVTQNLSDLSDEDLDAELAALEEEEEEGA